MNDRHLDPPEDIESPEWYAALEDVLSMEETPDKVCTAIKAARAGLKFPENIRKAEKFALALNEAWKEMKS